MSTFRQRFKQILISILFVAIYSASNSVFAETSDKASDDHQAHKSLDWPGIYNGFLPCADCMGLKMSLALNKNGSYVLITQYVGRSPRDFVEKGKYSWGDKENTIVLTPRKKSADKHYFSIGENMLIKLDDNGNKITGKEADRYILRRNDVTDTPSSSSSHAH